MIASKWLQRHSLQTASPQARGLRDSISAPLLSDQPLKVASSGLTVPLKRASSSFGPVKALNSPTFSGNGQVSSSNSDDVYRFTVGQSGIFSARLTGLTGDADVRLIRDRNNNGAIDQDEILGWQWQRGTGNEFVRRFIAAGTYLVQVMSYNNQTANYSLATDFTPASSDNRQFSIQVNFQQSLGSLGAAARDAIQNAADFWERVIPYSTFGKPQTLTINVVGKSSSDSFLAYAGPRDTAIDLNGHELSVTGEATVNTRYNSTFNQNPDYLQDIMTHEFGHVLGIGTFWEDPGRNFINTASSTYRANTYAGWAYGELLGTFTQTAVPVEPGSFGHWDENTFDQELMTPFAESQGTATPLSQVTIASLRDLGWNVNYGAAQPYSLPGRTQSLLSTAVNAQIASSNRALFADRGMDLALSGQNLWSS